MSKVEVLRGLVRQRLTAAADEILELFVKTIAEYEELAQSSVKPAESRQQPADVQQVLANQQVPQEQQKWKSGLDENYASPPHIEVGTEGLWSSRDGQQLQGVDRVPLTVRVKTESHEEKEQDFSDILKVGPSTNLELPGGGWVEPSKQEEWRSTLKQEDSEPMRREHVALKENVANFSVRRDDDEVKAQFGPIPHKVNEEPAGSGAPEQMETESGGEDCGGPAAAQQKPANSSGSETEDSDDEWTKTKGQQFHSKLMKNYEAARELTPVPPVCQGNTLNSSDAETEDSDCEQSKVSALTTKPASDRRLQLNTGSETGRLTFCCSHCDKRFIQKAKLSKHMRNHSAENCSGRKKGASLRAKNKEDRSSLCDKSLKKTSALRFKCKKTT
ncbi:uncharacterized protein [Leuresthes tenuis]|uniref:uncharacterized protein n=1 Tax=Leuresthes tenuis TaxID=355514 RepID=UPI003B50736A